jgi:acyl-CoA thioester hydrolase
MIVGKIELRVRYSDTDKMGYLYYGRYANFYEVARVELFRSLGFSYRTLENEGVGMPVINMNSKFIHPLKYDELVSVKTYIKEKPSSVITFEYEIFNENKVLANIGKTQLTFINLKKNKVVRLPKKLEEIIIKSFEK